MLIGRRVPESIQAAGADVESAVVLRRASPIAPFINTHHPFGFGIDKPDVRLMVQSSMPAGVEDVPKFVPKTGKTDQGIKS